MHKNKPRFHSLADALAWIASRHERTELRIWQAMQLRDLEMGGGWD